MLDTKRFLEGIGSGISATVLKTALTIWVYPIVLRELGAEQFGLLAVLLLAFEANNILQIAIGIGIVRHLGEYRAKRSEDDVVHLMWVAKLLFTILPVILLVVGLLAVPLFIDLLNLPPKYHGLATICLRILAFDSVLQFVCGLFVSIVRAHYYFKWINFADLGFHCLAQVGMLAAVVSGHGLVGVACVNVLATVGRLAYFANRALVLEPDLPRMRAPYFSKPHAKSLAGFATASVIMQLSVFLGIGIDSFVLSSFLGLYAVATLEVVNRIMGFCPRISFKISESLFPAINQLQAAGATDEVRPLFLRMSHLSLFIAGLMLVAVVGCYKPLFSIFAAGQIRIGHTYGLLALITLLQVSGAMTFPVHNYLLANNRQHFMTVTNVCTAILNLALSVLFVQWLGIIGVLMGSLVAVTIQNQGLMQRLACKMMDISFRDYWRAVVWPSLLPWAVAAAALAGLRYTLVGDHANLLTVGMACGVSTALGGLVWGRLCAEPREKTMMLKVCHKLGIPERWAQRYLQVEPVTEAVPQEAV